METSTKNANDNYGQFVCTDHYYKHFLGFTYTDGVKQVAEDCGAYWFIDIVASYYTHPKVRREGFQTWELKRTKDDRFLVTATDGNGHILVTQKIPYSDFTYDTLTFWCIDKVIILPSEY